jgi:hypothetical protein
MKYSLTWSKKAEDAMIAAWLDAPSEQRPTISLATHTVESELQTRPNEVGESRPDGRRMAICLPVALTYKVSQDDMLVRVEAFRLIRRRGR